MKILLVKTDFNERRFGCACIIIKLKSLSKNDFLATFAANLQKKPFFGWSKKGIFFEKYWPRKLSFNTDHVILNLNKRSPKTIKLTTLKFSKSKYA